MADFKFTEIGKLGNSISAQKMEGAGNVYFRITKLFKTADGEWKPTKQGVSIPAEQCPVLLDQLKNFIKENEKVIGERTQEFSGDEVTSDLGDLP